MKLPVGARGQVLLGGDVVVDEHRVQHFVAARESVVRPHERVVDRRRLRQAREQRGLVERQLACGLGEVRLGRRLDTVRVVAVIDLVEVRGEDALLRPVPAELDGETRLGELPLQRLRARQVEVPHELLRDRRAALHDPARANVGDEGARDPDRVDATVLVEAPVLDRDGRLRHP